MNRVRPGWPLLLACGLSFGAAGCFGGTSRATRFYTLTPLEAPGPPVLSGSNVLLSVGPLEIPDYLERPQIVTRTGENELIIAEFDRWAGSLEREITGSLVATLTERLASRSIIVFPWKSVTIARVTNAYRVPVTISRFDGILGQSVVLRGRWEVLREGARAESLAVQEAMVNEKIDGTSYEALVAAMHRALTRLGLEVASSISAAGVAKEP